MSSIYNLFVKYGQTFAFGLGIVILFGFLASVFSGMESFTMLDEENQASTGIFNFGLASAIALVIIAAIAIVVFGLIQTLGNLKGSLMSLIGLGVVVAIFLIAYTTGSVETSGPVYEAAVKQGVTDADSKFISGGITTALILGAGAFFSFIIFEVLNFFK